MHQILIGELGRSKKCFYLGFDILSLLLNGKIAKIAIYEKGWVNDRTNYDFPWSRWVPRLKYIYIKFQSDWLLVCLITKEPLD